mmetsp:Transcript_27941/g.83304  ORF Transcript_27941/g.83304 Transcript_27941/m.83304 type:complete len:218 (+) Transcript_27941:489-1142(+)
MRDRPHRDDGRPLLRGHVRRPALGERPGLPERDRPAVAPRHAGVHLPARGHGRHHGRVRHGSAPGERRAAHRRLALGHPRTAHSGAAPRRRRHRHAPLAALARVEGTVRRSAQHAGLRPGRRRGREDGACADLQGAGARGGERQAELGGVLLRRQPEAAVDWCRPAAAPADVRPERVHVRRARDLRVGLRVRARGAPLHRGVGPREHPLHLPGHLPR